MTAARIAVAARAGDEVNASPLAEFIPATDI
jgi:hypothetical protein